MLEGVSWHGTGLLCLVIGIRCIQRTVTLLRAKSRSVVLKTIGLGIVSGFFGVIYGVLMLLGFDTVLRIEPNSGINFVMRGIVCTVFFYFGAFLMGTASGTVLRTICHAGAVTYIALVIASLFVIQPIAYGWIQWLFSNA